LSIYCEVSIRDTPARQGKTLYKRGSTEDLDGGYE
jgi:hypothetical protein